MNWLQAAETKVHMPEMDALRKHPDGLIARSAQAQPRWEEQIKRILQELRTLQRQKHASSAEGIPAE
jgi:hypothetical protein